MSTKVRITEATMIRMTTHTQSKLSFIRLPHSTRRRRRVGAIDDELCSRTGAKRGVAGRRRVKRRDVDGKRLRAVVAVRLDMQRLADQRAATHLGHRQRQEGH